MCVVPPSRNQRRATVLVMVVGVLAMLFIIGSTLLVVARFERQTAEQKISADNMKAVASAVLDPVINQLGDDIRGSDGVPYNRGWHIPGHPGSGDESVMEDASDFPGLRGTANPFDRMRNGDLLVASPEPFAESTSGLLLWYARSWAQDAVTDGLTPPRTDEAVLQSWRNPGTPLGDADGDGIPDSPNDSSLSISGAFGGTYNMFLRIIPHGSMVHLDPMTHPSLLAQGLHPSDTPSSVTSLLQTISSLDLSTTTESQLRRRYLLAGSLSSAQLGTLSSGDARRVLPITLGYRAPNGAPSWFTALTPHWGLVDETVPGQEKDLDWWANRVKPGPDRTSGSYQAGTDLYDRRHLLTTISSDDVLRPQRDELRLRQVTSAGPDNIYGTPDDPLPGSPGAVTLNAAFNTAPASLYYILNPDTTTPATDGFGLTKFPGDAYGRHPYVLNNPLAFNDSGLRTQFSLRDVLVDPTLRVNPADASSPITYYQASYRRAVQLTAYYLAMIQHTSVPGSSDIAPLTPDLQAQLKTAAQLAVNTIDFADNGDGNGDGLITVAPDHADNPSYFAWPPGAATPLVEAIGVEKQPYITEAYAKIVQQPDPIVTSQWAEPATAESIYAIELYNPYDTPIRLAGFVLGNIIKTAPAVTYPYAPAAYPDLDFETVFPNAVIPPFSYIVITSRPDDVLLKPTSGPFQFPATARTDVLIYNVANTTLAWNHGEPIVLKRKYLDRLLPNGGVQVITTSVAVDTLHPTGLGNVADAWARPGYVQGDKYTDEGGTVRRPSASDRLVRDTSLQRHKDLAGRPPVFWHCTLSRQMLFPLAQDEASLPPSGLSSDVTRPAQHNLLGNFAGNQQYLATETVGLPLAVSPRGNTLSSPYLEKLPIAPFPVLVSDLGVETQNPDVPTKARACRAFPTTGSLLLVTRYGPDSKLNQTTYAVTGVEKPLTQAAAEPVQIAGTNGAVALRAAVGVGNAAGQMQQLDNGHMPIFDSDTFDASWTVTSPGQSARDIRANVAHGNKPQGRFDVPWGQLVYQYFTALPLEELLSIPTSLAPTWAQRYKLAFSYDRNGGSAASDDIAARYPLVDWVTPPSGTETFGPKVNGRVNINYAPWWVLDGLPALPDAISYMSPTGTATFDLFVRTKLLPTPSSGEKMVALSGLPVPQIQSTWLDPEILPDGNSFPKVERPGYRLMQQLFEDSTNPAVPYGLPTVTPGLAQLIALDRMQEPSPSYVGRRVSPGYLTTGGLGNLLDRVIMNVTLTGATPAVSTGSFPALRTQNVAFGSVTTRPFAYLGYLQLVAPLVRIQDWATVKNHVFTIYSTLGDNGNPPVWLRTQVTVDRTRCLYTRDLPAKVAETDPIGYYNAVNDQ